jgi:plastocyanin
MALVVGATASAARQAVTKHVSITRTAFVPSSIAITTGDSITWTNSDSINHQVVSQSAGFASPILKPGETFSFTYTKTGKFNYKDALSNKTGNGTVTVTAAPVVVNLTLASKVATVVYGSNAITLSGQLTGQNGAQQVTLNQQAVGEAQAKALTTVTTDANGMYSFTVTPTIRTVYTATWVSANGKDKASSAPLTVNVRPRVGLGLKSHRGLKYTYLTKVTSDISYAGRVVSFQRYAPAVRGWITLKRVVLSSTSRRTFTVTLRPRLTKVRVFLPAAQAGEGYTWGVSRSLLAIR